MKRDTIHKIKTYIIKSRTYGIIVGQLKVIICVNSPQGLQFLIVYALKTDAQTIYTCIFQKNQIVLTNCSRIAFKRDFHVIRNSILVI